MNQQSKKGLKIWVFAAVVMLSSVVQADSIAVATDPSAEQRNDVTVDSTAKAAAPQAEPKFIVLEDRIHTVRDSLSGQYPVHYYGFVAMRGQDVLLDFSTGHPGRKAWKVEYNIGGDWELLNFQNKVFNNLAPGAMVIVRILPRDPAVKDDYAYDFTFGSYPVLKHYKLKDEPGVLRIPSGYTEPAWLATQAYRATELEIEFTDTKDAPLAGGVAYLVLRFGKNEMLIKKSLVSGADGRASERIELGKCYGGHEAKDFVHKHIGFNTWRSWYKLGGYEISNVSLGTLAPKPHLYYLGHICTQRLQRTVSPRG